MKKFDVMTDLNVASNERVFKEAAKRMKQIYFIKNKRHPENATFAFVFEGSKLKEIVELDYETLYEMQAQPSSN